MDSCSSWSPPPLSPEALPLLDLILPSVLQDPQRGFCPKEEEGDDDGDGFSSCLSTETFPLSSHFIASPQSSSHDRKSVVNKSAQEDGSSLPPPFESADGYRETHVKRPKLDQFLVAPKTQANLSQVPKLGEKITALQQLVSPFGKTDTASVLMEAIGYIKFLQDQVHVLSSPYMKASGDNNRMGSAAGMDLRSRGLCLVPIACTMNVANSNGADYWISGIKGCRR